MEGAFFLGVMWAVWIWATFLLDRHHRLRFPAALVALLLVISFPHQAAVVRLDISWALIVIMAAGYGYFGKFSKWALLARLAGVFIVMTGYAGLLLFELYDPVWMFAWRTICYSLFLFILVHLLFRSKMDAVAAALTGTAQGEILYALVLAKWDYHVTAGSAAYLDIAGLFLLYAYGWHIMDAALNLISEKAAKKERPG